MPHVVECGKVNLELQRCDVAIGKDDVECTGMGGAKHVAVAVWSGGARRFVRNVWTWLIAGIADDVRIPTVGPADVVVPVADLVSIRKDALFPNGHGVGETIGNVLGLARLGSCRSRNDTLVILAGFDPT